MSDSQPNPYRFEILFTWIAGPLVMGIEIWRHWGSWFNPGFYDDYSYFIPAMFAAWLLHKRNYFGQLLWLFMCGAGTFMIYFSLFYSLHTYEQGDISGVAMPGVVGFKLVGTVIISFFSYRAFIRLQRREFF